MRTCVQSPETRAKKSKTLMGNTNALGHRWSEEDKARLAVLATGRTLSPENRAKLLAANMGNKHGLGHVVSPENRAKTSARSMGNRFSWRGGSAVAGRRSKAQRRALGFIPMNQPFVGCEGHHLNQTDVIYIPKALHRSIGHNVFTGRNMAEINAKACQWLTEDWT